MTAAWPSDKPHMPTLLVIDDDRAILHMVEQAFVGSEVRVRTASTGEEALECVRSGSGPDVVLLDIMLAETSGLELVRQIHALDSKLPVIFITAGGSSDTAIEAMKLGAYDYLLKPLDLPQLKDLVARALEIRRLMQVRVDVPRSDLPLTDSDAIVGRSPVMQEVYKAIGRVAPQDVTVLIRGESGTGKELVARALYQHSRRGSKRFLAVNCAAIPEALLESELFGHEKGSFTSADHRRIGKFEQCSGGTIFLDEVGDMTPLVQSKLLRVLQEQRFERVGGTDTIETDVRVVAATNRDLDRMVADGEFREDLYYRLNGFTIKLPPLRDRGTDIVLLVEHCLQRYRLQFKKDVRALSPPALNLLLNYSWPGNVRELQGVLRQALLQTIGEVIVPEFLPESVRGKAGAAGHTGADRTPALVAFLAFIQARLAAGSQDLHAEAVELMERQLVAEVLRHTSGNQSQAAKILGITRGSLRNKIRSLGISLGNTVLVDDEDAPQEDRAEQLAVGS